MAAADLRDRILRELPSKSYHLRDWAPCRGMTSRSGWRIARRLVCINLARTGDTDGDNIASGPARRRNQFRRERELM